MRPRARLTTWLRLKLKLKLKVMPLTAGLLTGSGSMQLVTGDNWHLTWLWHNTLFQLGSLSIVWSMMDSRSSWPRSYPESMSSQPTVLLRPNFCDCIQPWKGLCRRFWTTRWILAQEVLWLRIFRPRVPEILFCRSPSTTYPTGPWRVDSRLSAVWG